MTVIRMLDFNLLPDDERPIRGNNTNNQKIASPQQKESSDANETSVQPNKNQIATQAELKTEADYINLVELNNDNWPQIFKNLPLKGMVREMARNLMVLENNNNTIIFALDASVESFKKPKLLDKLTQTLAADKQNYQLKFCVQQNVESVARKQADADKQTRQQRQQNKDPVVEALQERFNATIINEKTGH